MILENVDADRATNFAPPFGPVRSEGKRQPLIHIFRVRSGGGMLVSLQQKAGVKLISRDMSSTLSGRYYPVFPNSIGGYR